MDVPGQSSTLAAVLALLLASSMVEGASFVREPAHLTGDTVSQGIIRGMSNDIIYMYVSAY